MELSNEHRQAEDYLLRLAVGLTSEEVRTLCMAAQAMLKMRSAYVPADRPVYVVMDGAEG